MKIKQLFLLAALLFSTMSYSQVEKVACNVCTDPSNYITQSGNTFTAATAQAYYWEICEGSATISGSRTGKSVTVSCTGNYKIKVTRFVIGNCIEACESATCNTGGSCPTSNNLSYLNEGGGGLCTTGLAILNNTNGVNYVNWTWALGGYSGTVNGAGTTTPIYHPVGNWTGYNMVICATAYLNNGTVCPKVCKSFTLNCGIGLSFSMGTVYPNPTANSFHVKNDSDLKITGISVTDISGKSIKSLREGLDQEIDLSAQSDGIYFVRMEFEDGTTKVEKLVLKK